MSTAAKGRLSLYDIPIEAARFEEQLCDGSGALTEEQASELDAFLRAGKEKIEAAAFVVKRLQCDCAFAKAESDRLAKRAAGLETAIERLRGMLQVALDAAYAGKVKTARVTVWTQKVMPGYQIEILPDFAGKVEEMAEAYPEYFRVQAPELNKMAIIEAFGRGTELPECIRIDPRPPSRFVQIR